MATKSVYAVAVGRKRGLFTSWKETEPLVKGFSGAKFKGFTSEHEATVWFNLNSGPSSSHRLIVPTLPHFDLKAKRLPTEITPAGEVEIYCDGACPNNGSDAARAGVGVFFGDSDPRNISARLSPDEYRQTNQVAELVAAIKALEAAATIQHPICIKTDSIYVVKSMNEWRLKWIQSNC